jgi:hypothetical protein|tara:strand:- start:239 stop:850 length:612 start_codon:yes stop_codon:yes gene_type:complete
MFRNFLTQLTRVTDTMVIIASALVVLAFLTAPEDLSFEQNVKTAVAAVTSARASLDNAEATVKKASAASAAARNALATALELETSLASADIASADELLSASAATAAARSTLATTEQALNDAIEKTTTASANIIAAESKTAAETAEAESAALRSVWWLQPIRQNTMTLVNAAGIDGFIAVFAALIFCLVYKRRKSWLQKIWLRR